MSKQMSSCTLFNRLQNTACPILVIDARYPVEISSKGSIRTAVVVELIDENDTSCDGIESIRRQIVDPQHLERFDLLVNQGVEAVIYGDHPSVDRIALALHLDECIQSAYVLADSFSVFKGKYPLLTIPSQDSLAQLPNVIVDGFLFLGQASQALQDSIVHGLQITHILNCASSSQPQKFQTNGIRYHHMRVDGATDIMEAASQAFDSAYDFIVNARACDHGRILIHSTYGRSRCCAMAVYYLMRHDDMSLKDSYTMVLEHRPNMHPKEAVLAVLCQKEVALRGISSLCKNDVKDMMQSPVQDVLEPPPALLVQDVVAAPTVSHRSQRIVSVQKVNSSWLFNRLQTDSGMILIDARPRNSFDQDTIRSALSIPPISECSSIDMVEAVTLPEQRYIFTRRKLVEVVIFTDFDRVDDPRSWTWRLCQLLVKEGRVTSVKLMEDGFTTFRFRYPFLSIVEEAALETRRMMRTHSGMHSVTFPNEILDGFLYLGNMWQASQDAVIENLCITHVINASLDVANVFQDKGLKYFNVSIKDKTGSDIMAFFDETYQFIDEAKRMPGSRVLVHCTQGVSRSATLIIAYLMRSQGWSLVTAVNHAIACRGVVYPNTGFLKQLMAAEHRLYRANSIVEEELDQLLQGVIPDRPVPIEEAGVQKQNTCCICSRSFSFGRFAFRHRCRTCQRVVCGKCSPTRLAVEDEAMMQKDENIKGYRVCNTCVKRLWSITLPYVHKIGAVRRRPLRKSICLKSTVNYTKPIWLYYYEGTDQQQILDVIRTRFGVGETDIVELLLEDGRVLNFSQRLPAEATVYVSIGATGQAAQVGNRNRLDYLTPDLDQSS